MVSLIFPITVPLYTFLHSTQGTYYPVVATHCFVSLFLCKGIIIPTFQSCDTLPVSVDNYLAFPKIIFTFSTTDLILALLRTSASQHTLNLSQVSFPSLSSSGPRTLPFWRPPLPLCQPFCHPPSSHYGSIPFTVHIEELIKISLHISTFLSIVYQHLTIVVFHHFTVSLHSCFNLPHLLPK